MTLIRALDISGLFHPIWRVKESQARPIGEAAAETVQALREHAARSGADFVVACCDAPGPTFRHAIAEEFKASKPDYRGYKGDRPPRDPAMMAALDRVIDELEQDGIPIMRVPGFEADDAIATITRWAIDNGHDVEIVSEDKDLLSLVRDADLDTGGPSVIVIRRDGTRQDADACVRRLGVPPALVPAFLALRSDVSDGVLGIPQVGDKTAVALLWGEYEGKEWRPTPYKRFDDIVNAAVEEQATIEPIERDILARRVHAGIKKKYADAEIAERLKITLAEVERMKAAPEPPKPPDYKAKFAKDVRQNLIMYAANFDIGLRLTRLREDVPLDFAAVTAPRVPKPKPHSDDWKEQRQRAANVNAAIAAEEAAEAAMEHIVNTEGFDPANVITPPAQPVAAKPPVVVEQPPPSSAHVPAVAPPVATTALALPRTAALTRSTRDFQMELEPRSYEEAMLVAEHAADSKHFKEITTPPQAIMLMLLGRKFGLSAVDSLRMIHMIEGKPSMSAQLIVGIVQKSTMAEYFEIENLDNTSATWVTKRKGARREQRWTFTIDDAKAARLGGYGAKESLNAFKVESNWAKHPKVMCMWRAAVFLARAVYTDLVGGLYMPDELHEQEGEIDGNPPMFGDMGQAA